MGRRLEPRAPPGQPMTPFSYRVAYRREDSALLTRHYETYAAACKKYRRIASIEQAKLTGAFEGTSLNSMSPLVKLRLEVRPVGPWEENEYQPVVTEYDVQRAVAYADRLHDQEQPSTDRAELPF
jgi:hypothetical protein